MDRTEVYLHYNKIKLKIQLELLNKFIISTHAFIFPADGKESGVELSGLVATQDSSSKNAMDGNSYLIPGDIEILPREYIFCWACILQCYF